MRSAILEELIHSAAPNTPCLTWQPVRWEPGGKKTRLEEPGPAWRTAPQLPPEALAEELRQPNRVLAVMPEAFRCVVLDIDRKGGTDLDVEETYRQLSIEGSAIIYEGQTHGGGLHIYVGRGDFTYPGKIDGLPCAVDVKHNGIVFWHDSVRPDSELVRFAEHMRFHAKEPAEPYAIPSALAPPERHYARPSRSAPSGPIDLARAEEALAVIANARDLSYEDWILLGQALHSEDESEAALLAWHRATARGPQDKLTGAAAHWRSFRRGGGVGFGTLVTMARDCGFSYHPPREAPAFPALPAAPEPPPKPENPDAGERWIVDGYAPHELCDALERSGGTWAKNHVLEGCIRHPVITRGEWCAVHGEDTMARLSAWIMTRCQVPVKEGYKFARPNKTQLLALCDHIAATREVFHPLLDYVDSTGEATDAELDAFMSDDDMDFVHIYAPPEVVNEEDWYRQAARVNRLAYLRLVQGASESLQDAVERASNERSPHYFARLHYLPHVMIVGQGGAGKSLFADHLLPANLRDYHCNTPFNPDDMEESLIRFDGKLVCELAEFDLSRAPRKHVDAFKSIASSLYMTVRRKYARRAFNMPLPPLLILTSNNYRPLPHSGDDALQRRIAGVPVASKMPGPEAIQLLNTTRDARLRAALRLVRERHATFDMLDSMAWSYDHHTARAETSAVARAFPGPMPEGTYVASAVAPVVAEANGNAAITPRLYGAMMRAAGFDARVRKIDGKAVRTWVLGNPDAAMYNTPAKVRDAAEGKPAKFNPFD